MLIFPLTGARAPYPPSGKLKRTRPRRARLVCLGASRKRLGSEKAAARFGFNAQWPFSGERRFDGSLMDRVISKTSRSGLAFRPYRSGKIVRGRMLALRQHIEHLRQSHEQTAAFVSLCVFSGVLYSLLAFCTA